jgi:hypothetical protein
LVLILSAIEKTPEFIENIIKRFYNLPKAVKLHGKEQDLKLIRVLNELEEEEIRRKKLEIERRTIENNQDNIENIELNELERNRLESQRKLIEEKEATLEQVRSFAEKIEEIDERRMLNGPIMERRFIQSLESLTSYANREKIELPE